jgi:predicted MFS family arabinose efflux permease
MDSGLGVRPVMTLAIACVLYALSIMLINIAPCFVGLYVDTLHVSLSEAGFVQTIDHAGGISGSVLGFFLMPRMSWRTLTFCAALAATIANAATAFADSYVLLCLIRFVAGFAVVLLTTVSACTLARARVPDRAFGAGLMLGMLLSAVAIWVLDIIRSDFGYSASLASGALWLCIAAGLALLLPRDLRGKTEKVGTLVAEPDQANIRMLGKVGLVALLLFSISANVGFSFTERVGLDNGLAPSAIASAFAIGCIFSLAGCLLPTIFGAAGGRIKWLVITTAFFVVALWLFYVATNITLYIVAFSIYLSVFNMGLAYYMSVVAENDPEEHYTRAIYIVNVTAQSLGPAIGALILIGYPIAIVFLIAPIPAIGALILVAVYTSRQPRALATSL